MRTNITDHSFQKSSAGAQASWRGYTSQTLYIASRLVHAAREQELYPEDVEDLVVKDDGVIIEAVQVKNLSSALTLSDLATSKTSQSGEGFFNRMCTLHAQNPLFQCIRVVYFNELGAELVEFQAANPVTIKHLAKKLVEDHRLSQENADWLLGSLVFEKADLNELQTGILEQIKTYVQAMPAPEMIRDLLIYHISCLSATKGHTSLKDWEETIAEIGVRIAALDGFYKEYGKSLIRLSGLNRSLELDSLRKEFLQGVSAHPDHVRNGLDFRRDRWLEEIQRSMKSTGTTLVKGVSGQGKSTLCYRYLVDTYPEECVFCVRSISSQKQADNLVASIVALGKHNQGIVLYIDVRPGETEWAYLTQELQARGAHIPVLISIRDEDYNATILNGKTLRYEIIELELGKSEASLIYEALTISQPHFAHRSFDEAWRAFGGNGPLIEFMFFLTNSQTFAQRLQTQVDSLLQLDNGDKWLELLYLVCYAGKIGCSVDAQSVKQVIGLESMYAAVRRFKDEYLIRITEDNKLEALHPVRAQIIFDVLREHIGIEEIDLLLKVIPCIEARCVKVALLEYFSKHGYALPDVRRLSQIQFQNWTGYASAVKVMLWLDVKRYVESNLDFIHQFIQEKGKIWLCFLPSDPSGQSESDKLIIESMLDLPCFDKDALSPLISEVKRSLSSLSIDYQATDCFMSLCTHPATLPAAEIDEDNSSFGYALFWLAQRDFEVALTFPAEETAERVSSAALQSCADAIRGLAEHPALADYYALAVAKLTERLIPEMQVVSFSASNEEVLCRFVPDIFEMPSDAKEIENQNQYWRIKMLNILQQMYPSVEYIEIELMGVDLFRDIGIEPMDHKLRIAKSNRHDKWVAEVNGWVKSRVDYSLRSSSWNEYVNEIDEVRRNVSNLVLETVRLIDDIYAKGRATKSRIAKVEAYKSTFRAHTFADNLLPRSAMDPYCLYSEGNAVAQTDTFFPMYQSLSVGKYERFRKLLGKIYTSLDNYFSQYEEVLLARMRRTDFSAVKKPELAMFNLFEAAKHLNDFQMEYEGLFSEYSSLDPSFAAKETECLLTLVNVWRHVLDNECKGIPIAYDAKTRYRKGVNYYESTLETATSRLGGTLIKTSLHEYLVLPSNYFEDNAIEAAYTQTIMQLRNAFESAIPFSSDRWYIETHPRKLAFVLTDCSMTIWASYLISPYRLLDREESRLADVLLPCEIDKSLSDLFYGVGPAQNLWEISAGAIYTIGMCLQRYSQVQQISVAERSEAGTEAFRVSCSKVLVSELEKLNPFANSLHSLEENAGQSERECLQLIERFVSSCNTAKARIAEGDDLEDLSSRAESALVAIILLRPYIAKQKLCSDCLNANLDKTESLVSTSATLTGSSRGREAARSR